MIGDCGASYDWIGRGSLYVGDLVTPFDSSISSMGNL